MKRKDTLLLHLLPMAFAATLVAAPIAAPTAFAQSPGAAGGASGNTAATGADTRSSATTSQNSTGTTSTTTPGTAGTHGSTTAQGTTGTGTTATTSPATTMSGTTAGTTAMPNWPADSVVMHRPRLSQMIGTNVYNDRNETIGEIDDIILASPAGMPATSGAAIAPSTTTATPSTKAGTTTGTTTTGTTTLGAAARTATAMPADLSHGPVAVIQVGGFLGMGGRLVAVPLSELHWNAERERVMMPNASKESLQGRPAFSYDTLRRG